MGVNAYGAMLTGASAIDGFRPMQATVRLRVVGLVLVGVVVVIIALLIPDNYLGSFNNFVILMLYFLVPWTAVNLVDFYFIRHGEYAITEIFNPRGIYGRWAWRGITAYVVGFVVMIPFFATTFYTGPVAQALGGADISFVFGLVFAGGLYYLLARRVDRTAELEARRRSRMELERSAPMTVVVTCCQVAPNVEDPAGNVTLLEDAIRRAAGRAPTSSCSRNSPAADTCSARRRSWPGSRSTPTGRQSADGMPWRPNSTS